MRNITKKYIELIEELKQKIIENDIIEILNVFDKIKFFWNKHKTFVINEISNQKCKSAIIGCMTYPHFNEKHYFIPLAHNEMLLVDEPISKLDNMIRIPDVNNQKKMLCIIERTVEEFICNKDIILNNNIAIIPLRFYYGLDADKIRPLADQFVYSVLSCMFNKKIEKQDDIKKLSVEFDNFDKIDVFVEKNKSDILFLGTDLMRLPISKRIERYYNNSGLDFNKICRVQSPIIIITTAIFGYSAQIFDIINTCEYTDSDLYLFIEIPTFYFNILLENIFSNEDCLYSKYLKTLIGYYLEKYLNQINYGELTFEQFKHKYDDYNLINLVFDDYIINRCCKNPTDIKSIKDFVEKRVKKFYSNY